jgi:HK97 family phage major capsid protein
MKMLDILNARVDELVVQRSILIAEMEAIPETALTEARSINDAEQAEFDAATDKVRGIDTDLDATRSRIGELEVIAARQETSTRKAPIPGTAAAPHDFDPTTVGRMSDSDARARAITSVERSRSFAKDEHRSNLVNLIEKNGKVGAAAARMALVTGSDEYCRGFLKHMAGNQYGITPEEARALSMGWDQYSVEERAMTSGTGSSGGYFVPIFIDPTMIITGAGSINPFRQISNVKTIGPAFGGWYGATAAQVTAAWTAEGSAAPDNTPTIGQPNIPVYMGETHVAVSFQAYEDIADLASDVVMLFSDAKDNLEATAHATGDGSSKPTGVSYAVGAITASRVAPATGGTLALADVFTVNDAIPARFRNSGSVAWASSNVVQSKIRQLAMAQNSANSVWTDAVTGVPSQLLGVSRYEASAMSASLTTGQDVLLVGDFSRYNIIDRIGFTVEFIPNYFDTTTGRPTAQRGWLGHWRSGANVTDVNAFRQLRL